MQIVTIDAGNTHIRLAIADTKDLSVGAIIPCDYDSILSQLQIFRESLGKPLLLSMSTVVQQGVELFHRICTDTSLVERGHLCVGVPDNLGITMHYDPTLIGIDRVVDAVAALALFPGRDLIVIDSGTATTVDCIRANRTFLGGYILPGLRLTAEALAEKTDKLPYCNPYALTLTNPPRSTREAVESGLLLDAAGGIERAIEESMKNVDSPLIVACGGAWELVAPYVRTTVETVPTLTLLGTALCGALAFTIPREAL